MPSKSELAERLAKTRQLLDKEGADGYIQTHSDEFLNEYLPDCNKRLEWLTGFDGSAGFAIVTRDQAVLFVDGRYISQAKEQAPDHWQVKLIHEISPDEWLKKNVKSGDRIVFDAATCVVKGYLKKRSAVQHAGGELVNWADNPVDRLWDGRPDCPRGEFTIFPTDYAGKSPDKKLSWLADQLIDCGVDSSVVIDPSLVSWLFNIRGDSIPFVPVALSHAIIYADGTADFFAFPESMNDTIRDHLPDNVNVHPLNSFYSRLNDLTGVVLTDPDHCTAIIYQLAQQVAHVRLRQCPTVPARAKKTDAELSGMRHAHIKDACAVIRFMHWWDTQDWQAVKYKECDIIDRLHDFRAMEDDFIQPAFDTICGAGPNGAIVHYRAIRDQDRTIMPDDIVLIDSGAHYKYGSTDITRMFATGNIPPQVKTNYTDVLKGHLAVQHARFPAGTDGQQIDALARQFLWGRGMDYHHGTGHGVGCVLSVHEGPQRLAKRRSGTALSTGMVVSDEPGIYVDGQYGIRIENILTTVGDDDQDGWHRFNPLTLVPYNRRFIDNIRLTEVEVKQIDQYHQTVWQTISGHLDGAVKDWLENAVRPLHQLVAD